MGHMGQAFEEATVAPVTHHRHPITTQFSLSDLRGAWMHREEVIGQIRHGKKDSITTRYSQVRLGREAQSPFLGEHALFVRACRGENHVLGAHLGPHARRFCRLLLGSGYQVR